MNQAVNFIKNRLSLRKPQTESLEILSEITNLLSLSKTPKTIQENGSLISDLAFLKAEEEKIKSLSSRYSEIKKFSEFERDFPNICFSLATGVGKTRLMGAFIAYLHITQGINNFFVLAPNLTIYNKLIDDFGNPAHPKYVFKGFSEFATTAPSVTTGDTYNRTQNIDTQQKAFKQVKINIFNISKINAETRKTKNNTEGIPKIKRLSEYLGESYFEYLSNLPDLVMLMDESHHYRAASGVKAINDLNPILGIEVTATPKVSSGTKFKNVVYEYSLAKAMNDGFVKEPAVATRRNFNVEQYKDNPEELDRIKLEDGIRIHEDTKAELDIYSRNNKVPLVKPFVLVVATDTKHAQNLEELIKSPAFFRGNYANKVMQIHSAQAGSEKEENVQQLLTLEDINNKIEIVIHVNMLKEGWDVTNLYTIIPLRAARADILIEQTIGRGLRLPYGKRTGNAIVDKLTIVAHDKFQALIDESNKANSIIKKENIIEIDEQELENKKEIITTFSNNEIRFVEEEQKIESISIESEKTEAKVNLEAKRAVNEAIFSLGKQGKNLSELTITEIKQVALENKKNEITKKSQLGFFDEQELENIETAIEKVQVQEEIAEIKKNIIEIPRISIIPSEIKAWFADFDLEVRNLNFQPVSEEILRKNLGDQATDIVTGKGGISNDKLENIIVNELINIPEINYDDTFELLFKLANQVLDKFKTYLSEDELVNVVQYHKRAVAAFIKPQLMEHFRQEVIQFENPRIYPFEKLHEHNSYKFEKDRIFDYRDTVEPISSIRTKLFAGFSKACHSLYKFDSKTEKDFAILIEDDDSVVKWLRPASNQFNIYWDHNSKRYEPDFIVETLNTIFMVETKKEMDIPSKEVQEKAKAALNYCKNALNYTSQNGGKPWKYILLPHSNVSLNMGFEYLAKTFEYKEYLNEELP